MVLNASFSTHLTWKSSTNYSSLPQCFIHSTAPVEPELSSIIKTLVALNPKTRLAFFKYSNSIQCSCITEELILCLQIWFLSFLQFMSRYRVKCFIFSLFSWAVNCKCIKFVSAWWKITPRKKSFALPFGFHSGHLKLQRKFFLLKEGEKKRGIGHLQIRKTGK